MPLQAKSSSFVKITLMVTAQVLIELVGAKCQVSQVTVACFSPLPSCCFPASVCPGLRMVDRPHG